MKLFSYKGIDLIKFICALFVVMIHINPFVCIGFFINDFFVNFLARFAVPFFLVTTGYFFFKKLEFENGKLLNIKENRSIVFKTVKRLLILYVLWSLIYLLLWQIRYWISIDWTGVKAIKDYLHAFFYSGSVYHFWYFVNVIYGIIFLVLLLKILGIRKTMYISFGYYIFSKVLDITCFLSVFELPSTINLILDILSKFLSISPFLMIGLLYSKYQDKLIQKINHKQLIGMFILYLIEFSILRLIKYDELSGSYIITMPFLMICIFCYILKIKINESKINYKFFRETSTIIYCVHPLYIYLLNEHLWFLNLNSILQYILVVSFSIITSFFIIKISKIKVFSKLKYLY